MQSKNPEDKTRTPELNFVSNIVQTVIGMKKVKSTDISINYIKEVSIAFLDRIHCDIVDTRMTEGTEVRQYLESQTFQ